MLDQVKHALKMSEQRLAESIEDGRALEERILEMNELVQQRELELDNEEEALLDRQAQLEDVQDSIEQDKRKVCVCVCGMPVDRQGGSPDAAVFTERRLVRWFTLCTPRARPDETFNACPIACRCPVCIRFGAV